MKITKAIPLKVKESSTQKKKKKKVASKFDLLLKLDQTSNTHHHEINHTPYTLMNNINAKSEATTLALFLSCSVVSTLDIHKFVVLEVREAGRSLGGKRV